MIIQRLKLMCSLQIGHWVCFLNACSMCFSKTEYISQFIITCNQSCKILNYISKMGLLPSYNLFQGSAKLQLIKTCAIKYLVILVYMFMCSFLNGLTCFGPLEWLSLEV